jgi:hypothetical protein
MKNRISYIDDEEDVIRQFKINTMDVFEVVDIPLHEDIHTLVESIKDSRVSALIVDYRLNSTRANIHYTGVDVISMVREIFSDFPCFILTSHESEAENSNINPDMIYPKEQVNNDPDRFNRKRKRKIENYYNYLESCQEELLFLMGKYPKLSLTEEERLIELDLVLENSTNKLSGIPKEAKRISNSDRLNELIQLTDALLKEIEEKNDD